MLVRGGEGVGVDFKKSVPSKVRELSEEICAFANAQGGFILIGVTDRNEIVGCAIDNSKRSAIQQSIGEISPQIQCSLYSVEVEGKEVWVIEVPKGRDKPYLLAGSIFVREGASRQKMTNVDLIRNTFIENIDACEASSSSEIARKNDYTGQAYAVRALCYFDLARLYGQTYTYDNGASLGAVLVTETIGPKEARLPRSTVAQTYEQVLKDLAQAKELLSKDTNLGHFNYWAARLLEARVYLYMGRNSEALTAAADVISNSPYRMVSGDGYAN